MKHFRFNLGPESAIYIFSCLIMLSIFACKDSTTSVDSLNNPPGEPYSPYPSNGASGIERTPLLSWECADPDSDLLLYDLYFGKTNPPNLLVSRWPNKHYQIENPLDFDTTYFWKVVAIDFYSNRTEGRVWGFHTVQRLGLYLLGTCAGEGLALNAFAIRDEVYIAAADEGMKIYDVTNPALAESIGIYPYPGIMATDVYVEGNYAFVADANHGLHLVDVSNPWNPYTAEFVNLPGAPKALTFRDNRVFAACDTAGLEIVNVTYILNPYVEGSLTFLNAPAENVSVIGDYACVSCGTRGLHIVDISDLTQPSLISIYDTPGVARGVCAISRSDSMLIYLADGDEGYKVIDITSPASPALVYEYPLPGFAYDICRDDNYIYVADGGAGLFMISDTDSVSVVASHATPGSAQGVFVSGNYIYVADGMEGVAIFEYAQ